MADVIQQVRVEDILNALYKNVRMAADSITTLMPKVTDESFRSDLTVELSVFEAFASRIAKELEKEGVAPKEDGFFTKAGVKMGSFFNTLKDSSTRHLAEMMIEGATMGVNDAYQQLHDAKETGASFDLLQLTEDILHYEEKVIGEMKEYLR